MKMMSWQRHPHPTPPDPAPAFAPMTGRRAFAWSLPLLFSRVLLLSQVLLLWLPLLAWADNLRVYDFDRDDQLVSADAYRPWAELMRRQAAEQPQLDACLADQARCPGHLRGFRSIVLAGRSLDRTGQLMLVERFIDRRRWRIESSADDEWRSLGTFLEHGPRACTLLSLLGQCAFAGQAASEYRRAAGHRIAHHHPGQRGTAGHRQRHTHHIAHTPPPGDFLFNRSDGARDRQTLRDGFVEFDCCADGYRRPWCTCAGMV